MESYSAYSSLPEVVLTTRYDSTDNPPPVPPKEDYPQPSIPRSTTACCICNKDVKSWKCVQCDDFFCDECWLKQRPHYPGKVGIDGRQHEKVDEEVIRRLKQIFGEPTQDEQERRHGSDVNTTWFGIDKEANQSYLHYSNRLVDIMQESERGEFAERFPQLVSFVGQTGAGKSTVIKMLINREDTRSMNKVDLPAPVPGLVGDNIPTTGDVHLYVDPGTYHSQKPILYADCEGMTGGEQTPRGLLFRDKGENSKKTSNRIKKKLRKRITWADDPKKQSREYTVTSLFPRILYTFSDVVVFVLREVRVFQTEVLQLLIHWAAMSIDKSVNQPSLPHIVIVLNGTEVNIDQSQWDPETATRVLLNDYKNSINQVPELQETCARLSQLGKNIRTTEELLEHYYSSVTVVRIPLKGRYMQIDEQVGKLQRIIANKCSISHSHKKKIRMLLSAERLPLYVNSAYDHFSRRLDEPFDFVEEARRHAPLPRNFGGHILDLILSIYDKQDQSNGRTAALLNRLCHPIAACIMLAATRDNTQGSYSDLLRNTYYEPLKNAFQEFTDYWLRCAYQHPQSRLQCRNAKHAHGKGHQGPTGRMLARGSYEPAYDIDEYFPYWIQEINKCIRELDSGLQGQLVDRDESSALHTMHRKAMAEFYKATGAVSRLKSHSTCLCCVQKIPSNVLPCGHVLCDPCVRAYGKDTSQGVFSLSFCPLHPSETHWPHPFRIRFKPNEAGVRVLCLDGGGARGIVELVILAAIERALGGNIPIQNFFDLIVGTSTGGIIALGLGVKGLRVANCMSSFKSLCKQAFTARIAGPLRKITLVSHKSYYKTKPLESALQDVFDRNSLLFGGPKAQSPTAIRVAVTSTNASDNRPVLLSNYNTLSGQRDHLPYSVIRPRDPAKELKVWEAARATAAAPLYFKPFIQDETGATYTDGAIHHNCPAAVADYERRLLWEGISDWPPDIFLSLGTGLSNSLSSTPASPLHPQLEPTKQKGSVSGLSFMWRAAYNIIDNQTNCEEIWKRYYAKATLGSESYDADQRHRNVRINVEFNAARPHLDDVESMEKMEHEAELYLQQNTHRIYEIAHRLVASCFYFEKKKKVYRSRDGSGEFCCDGRILCRFDEGSQDLRQLGYILRDCIRGSTFEPYFFLQENYGTAEERQYVVPISIAEINAMCNTGHFKLAMDLQIGATSQSSMTMLSLRLQPESYGDYHNYEYSAAECYLSISGFPRALYAQDSVPISYDEDGNESGEEKVAELPLSPDMPTVTHSQSAPDVRKLRSKRSIFNRRHKSDNKLPVRIRNIDIEKISTSESSSVDLSTRSLFSPQSASGSAGRRRSTETGSGSSAGQSDLYG